MISKKSSQESETNKIIQEELDEYLNPPPKGLQYSNGSGGVTLCALLLENDNKSNFIWYSLCFIEILHYLCGMKL